jgi:hypothetical protein
VLDYHRSRDPHGQSVVALGLGLVYDLGTLVTCLFQAACCSRLKD